MSDLLPLRYIGDGLFKCLYPNRLSAVPVGEVRAWQMMEARSKASHDHFFAIVHEAWKSLPEDMADDFPSPDHLRKWALIKAGFCTMTKIVCANNDEAANLLRKWKSMDRFSIVEISGKAVTIWTADSQRRDAQGRKAFQEAKEAALHVLSNLIGTDVTTLKEAARENPQ